MNKPEPIYLPEADAIESFAPEPGGEPRRTARDSFAEPLDVFRSEVFAKTKSSPRTSGRTWPRPSTRAKSMCWKLFR